MFAANLTAELKQAFTDYILKRRLEAPEDIRRMFTRDFFPEIKSAVEEEQTYKKDKNQYNVLKKTC